MHEVSLAQNLLQIVLDKAEEYKAKKVTRIRIKVGKFAGVNSAALRFAFQQLSKKTIAQEASFQILSSSLLAKCRNCQKRFKVQQEYFACPKCNSQDLEIISGQELFVQDIEVEKK